MYDILELNEKLLPELRQIAKDLNIKRVESYKKQDLIYAILDEQAIHSTKGAKKPEKKERTTDEPERKRGRKPKNTEAKKEEPTAIKAGDLPIKLTTPGKIVVKDTTAELLNEEVDDIIITDDKHIWVETKCKKDGIVTTDITETVKDLMLYLMQEDQKSA